MRRFVPGWQPPAPGLYSGLGSGPWMQQPPTRLKPGEAQFNRLKKRTSFPVRSYPGMTVRGERWYRFDEIRSVLQTHDSTIATA